MRALVQRVTRASVDVGGERIAEIGAGLLVLVGVTHSDDEHVARSVARKLHSLRILTDERSVAEVADSAVLVVSQFTLYGDARKGRRPTWVAAAPAAAAEPLIAAVVAELRRLGAHVLTGRFGADMQVELTNDGPITVLIEL